MAAAAVIFFRTASTHASVCVPGQQVSCACPGGTSGAQVCSSDGARFEACTCQAPAPAPAPASPYAQPGYAAYPPGYQPGYPPGYNGYPPYRRPQPGKGLFTGGLIMTIFGAATLPIGIGLGVVGGNHSCKDYTYTGAGTSYSSSSGKDGSLAFCAVGAALVIIDVGLIGGGIVMMIVGKNRAASSEVEGQWWMPRQLAVSSQGMSLGWKF